MPADAEVEAARVANAASTPSSFLIFPPSDPAMKRSPSWPFMSPSPLAVAHPLPYGRSRRPSDSTPVPADHQSFNKAASGSPSVELEERRVAGLPPVGDLARDRPHDGRDRDVCSCPVNRTRPRISPVAG